MIGCRRLFHDWKAFFLLGGVGIVKERGVMEVFKGDLRVVTGDLRDDTGDLRDVTGDLRADRLF